VRTVITHFFNEEYLLPWWLEHHVKLFEHGILIDHGSTDNSADICRQIAPHWQLVKSRLTHFDAWLTDFEVMTYELEVKGWKIALNTTEFLIANPGLDEIELFLKTEKRVGVAASGMIMIDKEPGKDLIPGVPLVQQKPWAIDSNRFSRRWLRRLFGYPPSVDRNRFYHQLPNGMYQIGRHSSFHPDWKLRMPNLMVLHYAYAPWNANFIARKMQISSKIPEADKERGWGAQHQRTHSQLQKDFNVIDRAPFIDLRQNVLGSAAIGMPDRLLDAKLSLIRSRK
jgi:hypothetical protein